MISVYLVQHGTALDKAIDEKRPLSDIGSAEVYTVAAQLKCSAIVINKIVHSSKLRAHQTASIFAEILNIEQVFESNSMKPNDEPEKLIAQMTEDAVMYIGHLPNIQNVVATLLTGNTTNPLVKFTNSAIACVQIDDADDNENHLNWFITPQLCL